MYIVLGATGHIGSALASILLETSNPVTVVIHDKQKHAQWEKRGAEVAVVDLLDSAALRRVLATGKRAFLLNPPAAPSGDTDVEERRTAHSIVDAVKGSGLEQVVVQSTYGAQPGRNNGDLGVLYELEQALQDLPIVTTVIRGAYYMSNWDTQLESARSDGRVSTLFPAHFRLPMVAPHDIAKVAAAFLVGISESPGLHYVEGPERYSASDVATAFTEVLRKPVTLEIIPEIKWKENLTAKGFSEKAADSMAEMTRITLAGPECPDAPIRGATTLYEYIESIVHTIGPRRA